MKLIVQTIVRWCLRIYFTLLYRTRVRGREHLDAFEAAERRIIVANHVSFLDGPLLFAMLPKGKYAYAMATTMHNKWWMKPAVWLFDIISVDTSNPMTLKTLIETVESGKTLIICPEGRISTTGNLMKIYDGATMIADNTNATLLPAHIEGLQWSKYSRVPHNIGRKAFPRTTLTFSAPRMLEAPKKLQGKLRKEALSLALYDIMSDSDYHASDRNNTLPAKLLEARKQFGGKHVIAEDINFKPVTYNTVVTKGLALGAAIAKETEKGEHVGVLLPTMASCAVTFFSINMFGRIPAMLNCTAGLSNISAACEAAQVKRIYTAKQFVEKAELEELIAGLEKAGLQIIYLEDVAANISLPTKLLALWRSKMGRLPFDAPLKADAPAAILFTSGSEGTPKGVVLSHRNLLSNVAQNRARLDISPADTLFNALPLFHSMGLTGGMLVPILSGMKVFLYPSPLHYRIVPEMVYRSNATIMYGTDTFLKGYKHHADPYDFHKLRAIFAGAEKVSQETKKYYQEHFYTPIFEGYGATETAPVIAINTPMHHKPHTVGRLLPDITYKLTKVDGIDEGGRLWVKGPNIMQGYLKADKPGELQPPKDGWYDTGDIVSVDEARYVTILGRAKRFAKLAGEMVSLTAVEQWITACWPEHLHAIITKPDAKKGEQLVLLSEHPEPQRSELVAYAKQHGISELMIPSTLEHMAEIPVLGTGKVDYVTLNKSV